MARSTGSNPRNANGHRRRELRKRVKSLGLPCAICGKPIDYSLPAGHPMSYELDEILPVALGGDPLDASNVQPAHRICNERKGSRVQENRRVKYIAARNASLGLPFSREW